jgi:hypothetical protein
VAAVTSPFAIPALHLAFRPQTAPWRSPNEARWRRRWKR